MPGGGGIGCQLLPAVTGRDGAQSRRPISPFPQYGLGAVLGIVPVVGEFYRQSVASRSIHRHLPAVPDFGGAWGSGRPNAAAEQNSRHAAQSGQRCQDGGNFPPGIAHFGSGTGNKTFASID